MTPLLNVEQLTKQYPTPRGPLTVLADVSLSLAPGRRGRDHGTIGQREEHAALHPRRARTADVRDASRSTAATRSSSSAPTLAAFRNEQIGFVFQDHCLLPQCSVLENVLIPTLVATGRRRRRRAGARL